MLPPDREGGIRLWCKVQSAIGPETAAGMLEDVLAELDRLRAELAGVRLELSVLYRGAPRYSPAERDILAFAFQETGDILLTRDGFTDEDHAAFAALRNKLGAQ